ncbi:hypothetical protein D3C72_1397760 [compost metagenome]
MTENGRAMRLKVSPMMGWLAGSTISLIPSLLSARHGISPVGAVLYRHHLPAELQFTEEKRPNSRHSAGERPAAPPAKPLFLGCVMVGGMSLHSQVHRDRHARGMGLLSEGARGRTRAALRSTSARDVRVPGRASPMAQGQAEVPARVRARRGSEGSKRLLKRGE